MVAVPEESRRCVECHGDQSPAIVEHWRGSTHAEKGVACVDCHQAEAGDADAFQHEGWRIATIVSPRDCRRCHPGEYEQFTASHHSRAGDILHSLDNFLAETVEGGRASHSAIRLARFDPHSPTPGRTTETVNGLAAAFTGCQQCHGSKVAFQSLDGDVITVDDLAPDARGKPTNQEALQRILRDEDGKPLLHPGTWPNTGIGRLNVDGSRGSCSACHSRHDFSARRARQPESCAKCHLGPDHPQKEIYEASKHGIAYRDMKDQMNLDAEGWVLGEDYSAAPTCATCHISAHARDPRITHDPGERISWSNRPPVSLVADTDEDHQIVYNVADPAQRKPVVDTAAAKRQRMKEVCLHCHARDYVNGFYRQYDDFIVLYNEKSANPGQAIMNALRDQGLLTATPFDEPIEWTWFYLWHHEGRRARHGASMMAPDYAQWHGLYEVAERSYQGLIPEAQRLIDQARRQGKTAEADAVAGVLNQILARPEHAWFANHRAPAEWTRSLSDGSADCSLPHGNATQRRAGPPTQTPLAPGHARRQTARSLPGLRCQAARLSSS
ncbi:MAG TPA: hydroxylamine oxidoreductase [Planctomycetaceae bacterium]|nr:hydroxylamine oxidoreductase [Planctomycetaceae bacterium]